jgi:hypothetical protein
MVQCSFSSCNQWVFVSFEVLSPRLIPFVDSFISSVLVCLMHPRQIGSAVTCAVVVVPALTVTRNDSFLMYTRLYDVEDNDTT